MSLDFRSSCSFTQIQAKIQKQLQKILWKPNITKNHYKVWISLSVEGFIDLSQTVESVGRMLVLLWNIFLCKIQNALPTCLLSLEMRWSFTGLIRQIIKLNFFSYGLKMCEFYINMLERFVQIKHVQCPDVKKKCKSKLLFCVQINLNTVYPFICF